MSKKFLEVKNVDFSIGGKTKVRNVSFSIEKEGDTICLLGPSGIGKTTILRTIAGLEKINNGSIELNGKILSSGKINISVDESSYLLGYSKKKTFMNIHVPFLRNSLLFVAILISLEIIRELPITLILRPFNFETFATTAYISASEDLLEAAAVPSLFLILIAAIFIMFTSKYILREK